MSKTTDRNRRFYENHVAPLIHEKFREYENRIAVGIVGEGSDCFGYDDLISRDHDFGTGVCLWIRDEDMPKFGYMLSIAYNELADRFADENITDRMRERRGVMTIHNFYSDILDVDCDTDGCTMSEEKWIALDDTCLATAVNGEVFRDDLGVFSAFRKLLLDYYPDSIWRRRLAFELHKFSAALQVNYARCMTRDDVVAAGICKARGIEAAMELFFLLKRVYPPYYKWTYRALCEMDEDGKYSELVRNLSETNCDRTAWQDKSYDPVKLNTEDRVVELTEKIAKYLVLLLSERGLITGSDPYLEMYVNQMI